MAPLRQSWSLMVILERFHDSRGETFGQSELPVEKGWFDHISSRFFIGTLALLKTLDLELQNIKRNSEISRKLYDISARLA